MISKTCGCCAKWDQDHRKILKPGRQLESFPVPWNFRKRYPLYLCESCDDATIKAIRG